MSPMRGSFRNSVLSTGNAKSFITQGPTQNESIIKVTETERVTVEEEEGESTTTGNMQGVSDIPAGNNQ